MAANPSCQPQWAEGIWKATSGMSKVHTTIIRVNRTWPSWTCLRRLHAALCAALKRTDRNTLYAHAPTKRWWRADDSGTRTSVREWKLQYFVVTHWNDYIEAITASQLIAWRTCQRTIRCGWDPHRGRELGSQAEGNGGRNRGCSGTGMAVRGAALGGRPA